MTIKLRESWADLMLELGARDERIVTLVGDISHGILQPYAKAFPSRYYNVGICEPSIVGIAAGLSHLGFVPFVHTIAPFLIERAFEQIKLDFGYQKLPVNLVSVGGSFDYGQLGCSHHTYADASMIASIEGSSVFLPGSRNELENLMSITYSNPGIKYFRLTENPHGVDVGPDVTPGKGIKTREGSDLTVICVGPQLRTAMEVAEKMKEQLSIEVLYMHTLKPFDEEIVRESVGKTGRFVTIEELGPIGGLYHSTLQALSGVDYSFGRQLSVSGFVSGYGSYDDLTRTAGISGQHLEHAVNEVGSSVDRRSE